MKNNIPQIIALLEEGRDNNITSEEGKLAINMAISWIENNYSWDSEKIVKKIPMYIVQDKEAGNKIDVFDTMFEAKKAIQEYEEQDNKEGTYTTGFYEIIVK